MIYGLHVLNKFDKFKWKVSAVLICKAQNLFSFHKYSILHMQLDHEYVYYIQ